MVLNIVLMLVVHNFLQMASSMLSDLTFEVLIPSVMTTLILQHLILHTNSRIVKPKLSHTHSLIKAQYNQILIKTRIIDPTQSPIFY
jgi:hypothetical protein